MSDFVNFAPLVLELYVSDNATSLSFNTDTFDFSVEYTRKEPNFALMYLGKAQLMTLRC